MGNPTLWSLLKWSLSDSQTGVDCRASKRMIEGEIDSQRERFVGKEKNSGQMIVISTREWRIFMQKNLDSFGHCRNYLSTKG